ncbi:MAG: FAD-binding oxidoreductase [Candidatus Rokubacteria bacterium]|nr:FAD-binding oxidoreductase [Candidatus Rokubacteria bacterium]
MSAVQEASVVVVGGGIWGCSIAYHLARAGVTDVVVLERRELACGNTPQAAGLVGQLRSTELMCRSIQEVVRRLLAWEREHGEECGFRQVGSFKLALTDARVRELEHHVAQARAWGLEVEPVSPKAAQAWVPFLRPDAIKGAAWIPRDGYVEPYTLAMAIARAARKLGVRFETQRAVTAITVDRGGVRGVETPGGSLTAPRVIFAAGPWVERVGEALGLAFDTVPLRHQHWTTAPMAAVPRDLPVVRIPDASVYIRPEVGGLMLGGFEARPKAFRMADLPLTFEIEHTEKDLGVLEELGAGLTEIFPLLGSAPVLKGCAGLPTFTPDGQYLLGEAPTVPGLYVAAGCNAIGIAGSLLIGEWMSELVLEGRTRADTRTQSVTRFGSRYASRRRLREACESIYANFYSLDKGAF